MGARGKPRAEAVALTSPKGVRVTIAAGSVEKFLKLGYRKVGASTTVTPEPESTPEDAPSGESEGEGSDSDDGESEGESPATPNKASSRADWSEYAESRGIGTEGLTKAQIIEAVRA